MDKKPKTSKSLLEKIMAAFEIGERGKFESFFNNEVKMLKRSIDANNRTIENLNFKLEGELHEMNLMLEDAKIAVEDEYKNITLEDISSNAKKAEFSKVYWQRVSLAEKKVESISEEIEKRKEEVEKSIGSLVSQNEKLQRRIDIIVGS